MRNAFISNIKSNLGNKLNKQHVYFYKQEEKTKKEPALLMNKPSVTSIDNHI